MDHNLDDSLNLESGMGVDFDHSEETIVNQEDISLDDGGHEEGITMEYEHLEEQSMLMDTGSEEIIVSDFIGDQFNLQDYPEQSIQMSAENIQTTQSAELVNFRIGQTLTVPASGVITQEMNLEPRVVSFKVAAAPAVRAIAPRKDQPLIVTRAIAPRQVAIAPKPTKIVPGSVQKVSQLGPGKQFAIAPKPLKSGVKPVTVMANKQTISQFLQKADGGNKGNTVLAVGKQLVMVPGGQQVVKLVAGAHGQAQLIQNVSTSQTDNKFTKVVVQAGSSSDAANQPAVITKLVSGAPAAARYVTVHKPAAKVVMASPTKSGGIKYTTAKKQLIAIQSPSLVPTSTSQGTTTKKVVISSNPTTQNVILKATSKPGQVTKMSTGQRTQLHPINVPGKGIQYIRLVTNPAQGAVKVTPKHVQTPSKTFVLTDGKGNLIQMTAEKMMPSSQPPPLVVTSTANNKVKTPHKLVRLAPISSKLGQAAMSRGGQSLLAPLSPPAAEAEEPAQPEEPRALSPEQVNTLQMKHEHLLEEAVVEEEPDSKCALQALIADTIGAGDSAEDTDGVAPRDTDTYAQSQEYEDSNSASTEQPASDHPLIVIPPYMKQDIVVADNRPTFEEPRRLGGMINVEVDVGGPYDHYRARSNHSAHSPDHAAALSDIDVPTELGMRPRKACNCTKSQCLKLYCDCFANGEFCNRCNCNNCHNNLENEELRQKAIRGCLDRNPNAFRPKIGKAKAGGVEHFRQHNKGCNCKRSGCLKNYCECYEAKIACTNICKCVGCRNVEETLERARRRSQPRALPPPAPRDRRRNAAPPPGKQPCSFMTVEVIEAVCQCLLAAAVEEGGGGGGGGEERDPVRDVIDEFARCLQDIISASHQATPLSLFDETEA